ncbi:hypothetical protein KAI19_05045, partial [bacterium]|nr:hypothetical protein [bacterium]
AKKLCSALYTQTIRLLQGVILLCKSGFDEEASILTRSLLENASYLLFISEKDHENRAELYQHSRALSSAQEVKEVKSMCPEGEKELDDKPYKKRERKALEYFRNKHGVDKTEKEIREKYTIKPRNASEQLKKEDVKEIFRIIYGIFYRPASSVTHAEAPLKFVRGKTNGICLKKFSSGNLTKMCLQTSTILVLCAIESLTEFLKINKNLNVDPIFRQLLDLFEK